MTKYDISKLASYIESKRQDLERGVYSALSELSVDVVERTPVDEGGARGSWTPDINKMSTNEGVSDPSGQKTIAAINNKLKTFELGDQYYLLSNLVYMPPLETGSSTQAPHGMLGTAIDNFDKNLDRAIKNVK